MATNDSYPPNVEAIEQRIKSIIFPRRIRIQEFIQRFDLLHHRVVGQQQFVRALNQCGVSLDHDEAKVLFHKYADEKTGGVRYYEFCDNINTVFRITQAEKNPLLEPPPPGCNMVATVDNVLDFPPAGACLPPRFTPRVLPVEKKVQIDDIIRRLALLSRARGIVFKYCYQDFDKLRSGYVSSAIFRRQFPFEAAEGKFTEEEIALLAEYFSREDADVNYNFIHNMIADKATELYLPFATSSYAPRSSNRRWSHEDMEPERKIQAAVVLKQLQMKENFKDVDHLRKGHCTRTQARAILDSKLNIHISDDDWDYLVAKYSRADGMFNYEALCDQIDRAFTMADLEKHPLARVNMPGKEIVEPAKRNRIQLLPEEEDARDKVATFQDYEHARIALIGKRSYLVDLQGDPPPEDRTITDTIGSIYFTKKGESQVGVLRPE
ncbi:putative EF hand protein [Toxoplasma gondii MAS]|uniref:Putative EF hand protein n=1 Tax=Toxoplasma gondii MAS TaxID=943118 RepID=A0A086QT15_TOXGO|nr:putative EF hand protein [Toxoplasma gondii MAS]